MAEMKTILAEEGKGIHIVCRNLALAALLVLAPWVSPVVDSAFALLPDAGNSFEAYTEAALIVRSLWFDEIVKTAEPCPGIAWDLEDVEASCNRAISMESTAGERTTWIVRDIYPESSVYRGHGYTVLQDRRIRVHKMGGNLLCGIVLRESCVGFADDGWRIRMDCKVTMRCGLDSTEEVSIGFRGQCFDERMCEGEYKMRVTEITSAGQAERKHSGAWVSRVKSRWRKPLVDIVYGNDPEDAGDRKLPDPSKVRIGKVTEKQTSSRRENYQDVPMLIGPFPAPLAVDTSTLDGVSAGWAGKGNGLAVAVHDNGERLAVVRQGGSGLVPGAVERISWVSPEGETFTVYLGADGLPIRAEFGETVLLFEHYEGGLVDIAVLHSDGDRTWRRRVPVDVGFVHKLRGLVRQARGTDMPDLSLLDTLKMGALALGIAGCASAGLIPGFAIPCAAVLLNRILAFSGGDNDLLLKTDLSLNPFTCRSNDPEQCFGSFLTNKAIEDQGDSYGSPDCSLPMISPFGCEEY